MIRPSPHIVPPGGYTFAERRGVELTADSFEKLVTLVTNHRVTNRYPLGDPESEVAQAICARHPAFCTDRLAHRGGITDAALPARALAHAVALYQARAKSDVKLQANPETVLERAKVCSACPHARRASHGALDAQVSGLRLSMTRSAEYPNLGYCSIFGHDNAVAAHCENSDPNAPAECWKHTS